MNVLPVSILCAVGRPHTYLTFDENRKRIAGLMGKSFFEPSQKAPPTDEKSEKVLQLLKTSPHLVELILSLTGEAK